MKETTRQAISKLLRERIALTCSNHEAPHDYLSVVQSVLQLELKQEIEALEMMLFEPETFALGFKERCIWREKDNTCAVSFAVMPESLSNQLYWEIAQLVFEPKGMKDMLEIIAPSIKQHLKIDLNYIPTQTSRLDVTVMLPNPTLELCDGLDAFEQEEPKLETLTHYVLSGNILLNAKETARLSLTLQAKLLSLLSSDYPTLAKQFLSHNFSLRTLSQDILALNDKGTTPKAALEQLIFGLTVGGGKMTGQVFAGKSSTEAVSRFFEYFNALPLAIKDQLRALRGGNHSLGDILDKEIATGKCVETTSTHLTGILNENRNQPVLTSPPELSPEAVKALKNKYGPMHELDTKKDTSLAISPPLELTQEVIGRIAPKTAEELMNLILDFPPSFYDSLWQHITLNNAPNAFNKLARLIQSGFFNPEQKQALAKALVKHWQRFNMGQLILLWALKATGLEFAKEILAAYPENERFSIVQSRDRDDNTPLFYATQNPELLKAILGLLPENARLAAVQSKDKDDNTPLFYATQNPELLKAILGLLPENARLAAVQSKDKDDNTPLFSATINPELLKAILGLLPENARLAAVQSKDKNGNTPLCFATINPELLKAILGLLPENARFAALQAKDKYGDTPLYFAANKPELLKAILGLLPMNVRFAALQAKDKYGDTPLYFAANKPELLKAILGLLPMNARLAAVQSKDKNGNTPLCFAANKPELFKAILGLLPMNVRFAALQAKDKYGETPLYFAANKPELLKAMLDILPEEERFAAVQVKDKRCETSLDYATRNPELLKVILNLLPANDRLATVHLKDKYGKTLLHYGANCPETLKVICDFFSKEQAALLEIKTALIRACKNYCRHHSDREDPEYQRGYQSGFFSSWRHGETGKANAEAFNQSLQSATSVNEAMGLIDTFLNNSNTRYHTHSFASYVLDEISALLPNSDGQADKPAHYIVAFWNEVKERLQGQWSNDSTNTI